MKKTGCVCPNWTMACPLMNRPMPEHLHMLCSTRPDYHAHFLVSFAQDRRFKPSFWWRHSTGLGDIVTWLTELVGIKGWGGCGCASRRARWNRIRIPIGAWPLRTPAAPDSSSTVPAPR